jgi:hypothetical protein
MLSRAKSVASKLQSGKKGTSAPPILPLKMRGTRAPDHPVPERMILALVLVLRWCLPAMTRTLGDASASTRACPVPKAVYPEGHRRFGGEAARPRRVGGDRGGSQGTWPQRTPFGGRLLLVVQSDAKVQRASAIFADCCTLAPAEDLLRGRQRDLPSLPLNLRVVVAAYDGPVAIDAEAGR